ncbi:hypothetical protein SUBVAR_06559 [Subdoligranulum variabile DSM 15176]|uniref:Uncharacterized protein n=1 Tax=Subdoligranulum variabile DSM 15176 TaxID=411471 RepID=D1PQ91_9FIRM|nr:hypothetical protein SUBVAR_06559 [Subdoligranulum variabile DSM 15176]
MPACFLSVRIQAARTSHACAQLADQLSSGAQGSCSSRKYSYPAVRHQ